MDYLTAATWEEKRHVVKTRRTELLECEWDYVMDIFFDVGRLLVRKGDDDAVVGVHWVTLDECRKKDIDTVFRTKKELLFYFEPSTGSPISAGATPAAQQTGLDGSHGELKEETMSGWQFARAKYIEGHSRIGRQQIGVNLVVHPTNLTLRRNDSQQALVSIPWANLRDARNGSVQKSVMKKELSHFVRAIPGLGSTRHGDWRLVGLWLTYWDEEVSREQSIFLGTGTQRNAENVAREIWRYRDEFYRTADASSSPQRR